MRVKNIKGKLKNTCFRKFDNKGSTIIMVIVAVAFVGMLASVILGLAMMNYQMKYTDYKAKRNFYSAETVLDQINAGLQSEVSAAFSQAYLTVMQTYSENNEEERQQDFVEYYPTILRDALKMTNDDQKYSLDLLRGYVDDKLIANASIESDTQLMVASRESGVVLKNLTVTYVDSEGYESIIKTDIRLQIPKIDFTQTATSPDLFKYCLVATDELTVGDVQSNVLFGGNIYGGNIRIAHASVWESQNAQKFIAGDKITVEGSSTLKMDSSESKVWAKDIIADGSTIQINAKCRIADDLVLKGNSANVQLKGEYYGYGDSETDSEASSSIIVNGNKATLNMSGLSNLLLAGQSFIGTGNDSIKPGNGSGAANANILMGESLAVKGSQIAYMVPGECIGVDTSTNEVVGGKNPMTIGEYNDFIAKVNASAGKITEVSLTKPVAGLGKSLNNYTDTASSGYKKIFSKSNGDTLVYYYIVMSKDKASIYFQDYYKSADGSNIQEYISKYVNSIQGDEIGTLNISGNIMSFHGGTSSVVSAVNQAGESDINSTIADCKQKYEALGKKLTENISSADASNSKTLFENLVKVPDLTTNYLNGVPGGTSVLKLSDDTSYTGEDCWAVLTKSDTYVYDSVSDPSGKVRLIVATGDVKIYKNFKGLVLAGGSIKIMANNLTITNEEEELTKVLNCKLYPADLMKEDTVLGLFQDGSNNLLNGYGYGMADDKAEEYIRMSDLVIYENWSKQ